MSQIPPIDAKTERWNLQWAVQRSQRYHARRGAFFDRWNKATALVGVIGGSAVMAAVGRLIPSWLASASAMVVVLMSGVDLVAGAAAMARQHDELRRRFCELEADMTGELSPTAEQLATWRVRRLGIEADEPATYVALDLLCENELARSYAHLGGDKPRHHVPFVKALTAHFFRWENA